MVFVVTPLERVLILVAINSLTLFLLSLQKYHYIIDFIDLSNFRNANGSAQSHYDQEQRKAAKRCDQKIFLIKEQGKLTQLN